MNINEQVQNLLDEYYTDLLPLGETDPEFLERFAQFTFDEVVHMPEIGGKELDATHRYMALQAFLLGCQARDMYAVTLRAAVTQKLLTPVQIKEVLYQAVNYLGMGRIYPFFELTNELLMQLGYPLMIEGQAQTTLDTRLEKGIQCQVDLFGEEMQDAWQSGPDEIQHIHQWLASNCFGDYYTRGGLDLAEREMVTFCYLVAQGGCEEQLCSHIQANLNKGNDRSYLIKVLSQGIPYIGYPRALNALHCIQKGLQ